METRYKFSNYFSGYKNARKFNKSNINFVKFYTSKI